MSYTKLVQEVGSSWVTSSWVTQELPATQKLPTSARARCTTGLPGREPLDTTLSFSRISEEGRRWFIDIDSIVHLALQAKYDQTAENAFYFAAVLDAMSVVVSTMILICVQGKYSINCPNHVHGDQVRNASFNCHL